MELKELDKFLKICRKQGVSEIICEGISVKFGELPNRTSEVEQIEDTDMPTLTPDELIFYHTNGGQG